MIQTPLLPAFANPVHDAQITFRGLLAALSHPGQVMDLDVDLVTPWGLWLSCGAAALTLLDDRTRVWISETATAAVRNWLQFHTGCRWVADPQQADFALVLDPISMPPLPTFVQGTPEEPEGSTTLLIQIEGWRGETVILSGPGIPSQRSVSLAAESGLVADLERNGRRYPQGVDLFLFVEQQVMGLPRSVICQRG